MERAGRLGTFTSMTFLVWSISYAAPAKPSTPVFGTSVTLVLLPVFVADAAGHAIRGLSPEDFELYEDGKRATLVSFRYVDTTSDEDQDEIREASAARRRFLLLFDKSFTDPSGLNRAQRAAAEFVRMRLAPSDLAAVATFDILNGVRIVANFTEDRGLLSHAIATLGVLSVSRISDPLGLAADFSATDLALPGATRQSQAVTPATLDNVLAVLARRMRAAEDEQYARQVEVLIRSLDDLGKGLSGVEGRKQILYFSAGFDSRLLIGQTGSEQRTASQSIAEGRLWEVDGRTRFGDSRLRGLLQEMTKRVSNADALIHAVDVTGLGTDRSLGQTTVTVDAQRDTSGREALNFLSAETGGRFFKDANDLGPMLDEMLDMTSRYYVLGFQPLGTKGPGASHKLKVKVARKGAKLSHRASYHERTPLPEQTALQRQFEAAQLVVTGAGPNDLAFSSLCLPFPVRGERQTLGLVVQVAKSQLQWAPGRTTSLEVYAYAVAEDGTVHDHIAKLARLDPGRADPAGSAEGLSLFGTLVVPAGKYTVRLMLQERESGAAGVQFMDITVPPYDPRVGFLLPPVLMDDAERWVSIEMGRSRGESLSFPFEVDGKPFLPRASFVIQLGALEKVVLLAYEPSQPGDPAAPLQIRSSLLDREGRSVPAGSIRIDKVRRDESGRRTYVLGYTPDPLAAGDYTLRIGVGESGSQLDAFSVIRVRPRS